MSGNQGGPGRLDATTPHKYGLTLTAYASNLLNHENLSPPNGTLSSPFFGKSQSLAGGFFSPSTSGNRSIFLQSSFNFLGNLRWIPSFSADGRQPVRRCDKLNCALATEESLVVLRTSRISGCFSSLPILSRFTRQPGNTLYTSGYPTENYLAQFACCIVSQLTSYLALKQAMTRQSKLGFLNNS